MDNADQGTPLPFPALTRWQYVKENLHGALTHPWVFAGQGGEASSYLGLSRQIPEFAWAFFNYRGYGLSEGRPGDTAIFQDGTEHFDYFSDPQVDAENIFVLGGSLGTGPAAFLSAHRPLKGAVLFSPYDKIAGGAAQDLMPFLPTRLLVKNRFDIVQYAPQAQSGTFSIPSRTKLNSLPSLRNPGDAACAPAARPACA